MKYPKLDPIKWSNAKLTVKERDEVDYYVNHAGWSLKRVAEMYHVSVHTAMYWSNPEFKRKDNIRAGIRMARKMKNPAYKKKIFDMKKVKYDKRKEEDAEFKAWVKNGWREGYKRRYDNRTDEDRVRSRVNSNKYYKGHMEGSRERSSRFYRKHNFNAFRMFQKHINSVSYADNICHSKKETRSTSSYKSVDVSPIQSTSLMVRKLYISLLSILRKISQPIHALRKGSLTTHK